MSLNLPSLEQVSENFKKFSIHNNSFFKDKILFLCSFLEKFCDIFYLMFGRNEDEKELNKNGEDRVCVGEGHHYELCVVNVVNRNKSESPESGDDTHRLHSPNINNNQTFIIQIISGRAQRRRFSARFLGLNYGLRGFL